MSTAPSFALAPESFALRHVGPRPSDVAEMAETLGYAALDDLIDALVPEDIRLRRPLALYLPRPVDQPVPAVRHR